MLLLGDVVVVDGIASVNFNQLIGRGLRRGDAEGLGVSLHHGQVDQGPVQGQVSD